MIRWGDIDKTDMGIIDDVSQFFMVVIAIITAIILGLNLPAIEPVMAQTEEPKTLGGPPAFWMTLYLMIALWMLYAWGYKPLAALYKSSAVQGHYLSALTAIFRASGFWGVLLSVSFICCSTLIELFEGAAPVINVISVGLLIGAWYLIDYKRYAALTKAFNASFSKPHPLRHMLKPFKTEKGRGRNG